ncbi:MAG: PASTA domain-containing protein [Balneolia bacterium]|nr:PASTA domain-containing protein [Balneolia bacterium]
MEMARANLLARIFLVFGVLLILPCAIIFQILRVQFMEGENLRSLWSAQAVETINIQAQRGNIYDASGRILVTNTTTYSVAVDPLAPGATAEGMATVAGIIGHITGNGSDMYNRRIRQAPRGARYIVLGRDFDRTVYDSLRSHRLRGLILEENYRRRYNFESLASHSLGHVNHELTGMMGIESSYNRYLGGRDGIQQVRKDSRGRVKEFVGAPRRQPVQGNSVHTTIDARIQAIVEEELREGVVRARAQKGTIVVVEPATGRVVALANYPDFNPNSPGSTPEANRRNMAIADMIEPGSTFKLVTAVAALEQRVVSLDEVFETPDNGRRLIHGQWMRDHDPLGTLTFRQAFEKSSNVATAEVAMRLERDTFYQYVRNFGFGTATSIDLPGEETGRLQQPYNWSLVTQPWMSVGYEVQVTPLQVAMAYASFANGGRLMRPYIVERVTDENGRIIMENKPKVIRQTVAPATIRELMPVLQGVVSEEGTAQFAAIEGLSIAGKTGTAQKFIDGRYRARYRASFVGFYPVEEPKYVAYIMLDEPRTSIFGGFMAGPIFRNIANRMMGVDQSIQHYVQTEISAPEERIAPFLTGMNIDAAARLLQHQDIRFSTEGSGSFVVGQSHRAGNALQNGDVITLTVSPFPVGLAGLVNEAEGNEGDESNILPGRIPDVRGMSMREAVLTLRRAGYEVNRNGSGTVHAQFPEAGAAMQPGRTVSVRGRARPMEQLVSEGRVGR